MILFIKRLVFSSILWVAGTLWLSACSLQETVANTDSQKRDTIYSDKLSVTPSTFSPGDSVFIDGIIGAKAPIKSLHCSILFNGKSVVLGKGIWLHQDSLPTGKLSLIMGRDIRVYVVLGNTAELGDYLFRLEIGAGDSIQVLTLPFRVWIEPKIVISNFSVGPKPFLPGLDGGMGGAIESNVPLDSLTFTLSKDGISLGSKFMVTQTPMPGGTKIWNLQIDGKVGFKLDASLGLGTYKLSMTAWASDGGESSEVEFSIIDWLPEKGVQVGAQGHPDLGTSLDLDEPKAMLVNEAVEEVAQVEILFVYSNGLLQFMTPAAAKSAGDVLLAQFFDSMKIRETPFVKAASRPTLVREDFAIGERFTAIPAVVGGNILLKTSEGNFAYVVVRSISGVGNTAMVELGIHLIPPE